MNFDIYEDEHGEIIQLYWKVIPYRFHKGKILDNPACIGLTINTLNEITDLDAKSLKKKLLYYLEILIEFNRSMEEQIVKEEEMFLQEQKLLAEKRSIERQRIGKITQEMKSRLWKEQKGRCKYCNKKLDPHSNKTHIDHIKPKSKGGTNAYENLAYSCSKCNIRKGSKYEE